MDWVVEDKKTREISTVVCVTYGPECDNKYCVINSVGVERKYSEKAFKEKFKKVSFDFSKIVPIVAQVVDNCETARRLLYPIARRIHPGGYYKVGCLVYFEFGGFTDGAPVVIDRYGKRTTYIITNISDSSKESYRFDSDAMESPVGYVELVKYRGPGVPIEKYRSEIPEFTLPLGKDILFTGDAYCYLKRYDQPY